MTRRIFQALPNFCPHRQTDTMFAFIPAPQGTGNDWKNLPGTAHTDRQTDTTIALIYKISVGWFLVLIRIVRFKFKVCF